MISANTSNASINSDNSHIVRWLPSRQVDLDVERFVGVGVEAEDDLVVGFAGEKLYLMPTGDIRGLYPNARVIPGQGMYEASVGDKLLGRVIDASGKPLDGKGPLRCNSSLPLAGRSGNPLARWPINEPLDVGVSAINSLLTVGRGQYCGNDMIV